MATISFCSYLASSTPDNFFVSVTEWAKKSKKVPFRKEPELFTSKAKIYDLFLNYPIPFSLFLILIFSRVILLSNFMEVIFFYAEVDSRSVSYSNLISFLFLILIIMPCIMIFGLEGVAVSLFFYALLNYIILNLFSRTDKEILFFNILLLILPFIFLLLLKYV